MQIIWEAMQSEHFAHIIWAVHIIKMLQRKILIISPGLILIQKAFLVGLFSGELIFGEAIGGNFAFESRLGLTMKTA